MLQKLDKKTKILISVVLLSSAVVCVTFAASKFPVASTVAVLAFTISILIVIVQINLDKRFITKTVDRLSKSANANGVHLKQLESLVGQAKEQISSSRRAVQAGQTAVTQSPEEISVATGDSLQLTNLGNSSLIGSVRNLSEAGVRRNTPSSRGRGAAAVARDPERGVKISKRLARHGERSILLIGSPKLEKFLQREMFNVKTSCITPSNILVEFQEVLGNDNSGIPPLFIIETKILECGIWGSALSSSGTQRFAQISTLVDEIRKLGGFSLLAGSFEIKNTFTNSLESIVDIYITIEPFQDDWSENANLEIPRMIQNYLESQ